MVGKGENNVYHYFIPFPQCFQWASPSESFNHVKLLKKAVIPLE